MSSIALTEIDENCPHLETSEILLQKILVAIDFSAQSELALKAAAAIGVCFGSEILLVHAAAPATRSLYALGPDVLSLDLLEMEVKSARAKMVELVRNEPLLEQLAHHEIVECSSAADLVKHIAREQHVDLVVAGSHGARGLELLALGSVAESILSVVPCPVLIVGPHCHEETPPFRSILFATDLENTGLRGAQMARSFAERFHAPLTLLHVVDKRSRRFAVQPELAEDNLVHEMSMLVSPDLDTYTTATIRVEYGKPAEIICEVARDRGHSLIVTGFGNQSSLGDHSPWSTLSQVIREAPCPVLSVRRHLI